MQACRKQVDGKSRGQINQKQIFSEKKSISANFDRKSMKLDNGPFNKWGDYTAQKQGRLRHRRGKNGRMGDRILIEEGVALIVEAATAFLVEGPSLVGNGSRARRIEGETTGRRHAVVA